MKPRVTKKAYMAAQGIGFTFLIAAAIWLSFWITGFIHKFYHHPSSVPVSVSPVPAGSAGPEHIFAHDAYLDAIELEESGGNALAMGDLNEDTGEHRAIGSFQLWKIYVRDFNRIQELNGQFFKASYDDRWNPAESRKITSVVTAHYADHDWQGKPHTQLQWIETAVRAHKCPTDRNKPSTKAYWLEVKARMESE